jgi:hypothetical protein
MTSEWNLLPQTTQVYLSREALRRARHIVAAQAESLAEQIEHGAQPRFDGPDALRLLAMILSTEADTVPTGSRSGSLAA